MGYDISGHEVIRHELYTVHNGGANNSHVAENADKEASDGNDDSKEDTDTDADSDEDDKCVGNVEDSDNVAGE